MSGVLFGLIFQSWKIDYVPNIIGIFGIIVVVIVGNILAFTTYMTGVKIIGPQKASLYSFAEPVAAAIISTTLLKGVFTIWDALGFGCIFAMMALLGRKK